MGRTSAVGEYLRARRALLSPEEVGFVADRSRKVEGLRREEVAVLAGISPEYYLRLEQGRDHQPSDQVLGALARALRLGPHGEAYLRRLARPVAVPTARRDRRADDEQFGLLLAQWRDVPAFIADANLDVVASNAVVRQLGHRVFSTGANRLVAMFTDEDARTRVPEWELRARELVGAFRMSGDPRDARYQQIVGELSVASPDFRRIWQRQDVHVFVEGDADITVPPFGAVGFGWRNFAVEGLPGHALTTFFARPGSPAVAVLAYLSACAAVPGTRDAVGAVVSPAPSGAASAR